MALVAELGTAKVYKIFKPTNFFADFLRFSTKKFDADFLLFQAITHFHFPAVLSLCDQMCNYSRNALPYCQEFRSHHRRVRVISSLPTDPVNLSLVTFTGQQYVRRKALRGKGHWQVRTNHPDLPHEHPSTSLHGTFPWPVFVTHAKTY